MERKDNLWQIIIQKSKRYRKSQIREVREYQLDYVYNTDTQEVTKVKVLIVSHSNVSVDGVIKQVVKMLDADMQSYLENGKILRFGYVRDDELSQNPYATSFNFALSKCDSYARQMEHWMQKRDELRATNRMKTKGV